MKDKCDLVNSIVAKARVLEEQGQFNEALGQWVLNHMDDRNYDLFEIDKRFLFRSRIRNGKKNQTTRIPHGLEKPVFYTVQLSVSPQAITTKIFDGQTWVTLDEWKEAGPVVGKFGFYIPGKDRLGLSHFKFKPR